jgi:PPM family protein phosphatase
VLFVNPQISVSIQQGNPELQDRAEVYCENERTVIALADGSGGTAGAAQAAEFFINSVRASLVSLHSPEDCRGLLHDIDRKLTRSAECGETTGIIVVVNAAGLFGAGVGDSLAWFFAASAKDELTRGQWRKPLLGTGVALPHGFVQNFLPGTLVVATDGLWKYTSLELIEQRVRSAGLADLAAHLAELVRLRSGAFPDDVAIVTATCHDQHTVITRV